MLNLELKERQFKRMGFTLLEVMLAVAILSLGLVIVIESFSISLRAAETSLNLSRVALLAQRKLSEIELEDFSKETDYLNSGDFGEDESDFSWEAEIVPVEVEEKDIWQKAEEHEKTTDVSSEVDLEDTSFLYQTTITIFWQERGQRRNLKFTTYLAKR